MSCHKSCGRPRTRDSRRPSRRLSPSKDGRAAGWHSHLLGQQSTPSGGSITQSYVCWFASLSEAIPFRAVLRAQLRSDSASFRKEWAHSPQRALLRFGDGRRLGNARKGTDSARPPIAPGWPPPPLRRPRMRAGHRADFSHGRTERGRCLRAASHPPARPTWDARTRRFAPASAARPPRRMRTATPNAVSETSGAATGLLEQ
jgi:hypothetical protein